MNNEFEDESFEDFKNKVVKKEDSIFFRSQELDSITIEAELDKQLQTIDFVSRMGQRKVCNLLLEILILANSQNNYGNKSIVASNLTDKNKLVFYTLFYLDYIELVFVKQMIEEFNSFSPNLRLMIDRRFPQLDSEFIENNYFLNTFLSWHNSRTFGSIEEYRIREVSGEILSCELIFTIDVSHYL